MLASIDNEAFAAEELFMFVLPIMNRVILTTTSRHLYIIFSFYFDKTQHRSNIIL